MNIERNVFSMPKYTVDPEQVNFYRERPMPIGQRIDPMGKDMVEVDPTSNYPDPYLTARKLSTDNMNA